MKIEDMYTAFKWITLATLALFVGGCGVWDEVNDVHPYLQAGHGLGAGDIRVKALPLAKVDSTGIDAVTVFVYDDQRPENHFSFTLERVNVRPGYSVEEFYNADKKLLVSAEWDGRGYVESTKMTTHVQFAIEEISEEHALIRLSARLVNPSFGSFLNLPPMAVKIVGPDLEALVKKS
ncbi:hypothetical protein HDC30_005778 [Pseudomonas sp. JAI115]|uniref:hypothetical protein n=1 Tax=Pseudomonas sp. JAI115 TaxID=2723061 RepID=UPI0016166EB0|nr:hypothetical protein [Pseudomonas sp. JAI115]MBB6158520.1 hypothetical protein [Pseudomonas sp. JAI115]